MGATPWRFESSHPHLPTVNPPFVPGSVLADDRSLWLKADNLPLLVSLDPATHQPAGQAVVDLADWKPIDALSASTGRWSAALAGGCLWVADPLRDAVQRLDGKTGALCDEVPVAGRWMSVAGGGGEVWLTSRREPQALARIERSGKTVGTAVEVRGANLRVFGDRRAAWAVANPGEPTEYGGVSYMGTSSVARLDPRSGSISWSTTIAGNCGRVTLVGDEAWTVSTDETNLHRELVRLDARSGAVSGVTPLGSRPIVLAADPPMWAVPDRRAARSLVARIDPIALEPVRQATVDGLVRAMQVHDGRVWIVTDGAVFHADAVTLDDIVPVDFRAIDLTQHRVATGAIEAYERGLRDAVASKIGGRDAVELEGSYPSTKLAVTFRNPLSDAGDRYGRRFDIWPISSRDPEDTAFIIGVNIEEDVATLNLVPAPDSDGITWITDG